MNNDYLDAEDRTIFLNYQDKPDLLLTTIGCLLVIIVIAQIIKAI